MLYARDGQLESLQRSIDELSAKLKQLSADVVSDKESIANISSRLANVEAGAKDPGREANNDDVDVSEDSDTVLEYQMGQTLWDMAAIIGLPDVGLINSLILLVNVVGNAAVQLYICWVLLRGDQFVHPDKWQTELEAARRWRRTLAHDYSQVDAGGSSLASRVCGQDPALAVSGGQASLLDEINVYTGLEPYQLDVEPGKSGAGPLLCMVCVAIFVAVVIKELRESAVSFLSMNFLPRGKTSLKDNRFIALSLTRYICILAIGLVRVTVAICLLYTGVMWLCYTISIPDLILNAAALSFVMDLDELLMGTTVPGYVLKFVGSLQPLRYRRPVCFSDALVPMVLLCGIVTACYYGVVQKNVDEMLIVKREMCGQELNFALTVTEAGYIVSTHTEPFPNATETRGIKEKALTELRERAPNRVFSALALDKEVFRNHKTSSVEKLAQSRPCQDAPAAYRWTSPYEFTAVSDITQINADQPFDGASWHCSQYQTKCGFPKTSLLRLLCPETCGCTTPVASHIFQSPLAGCPRMCEARMNAAWNNTPCEDLDVLHDPAVNAMWVRWWQSYKLASYTSKPELQKDLVFQERVRNMTLLGCAAAAQWDPANTIEYCDDSPDTFQYTYGLSTLRGFCPLSCCCYSTSSSPSVCTPRCEEEAPDACLWRQLNR